MDDRPRTHACETPHPLYGGSFPLSAITSAQPPWMTFAPRIIYGQGQDTRAHNNWPSPGPPGTTNKVTGTWGCSRRVDVCAAGAGSGPIVRGRALPILCSPFRATISIPAPDLTRDTLVGFR